MNCSKALSSKLGMIFSLSFLPFYYCEVQPLWKLQTRRVGALNMSYRSLKNVDRRLECHPTGDHKPKQTNKQKFSGKIKIMSQDMEDDESHLI